MNLDLMPDTFNLMWETGLDGDRIARRMAEAAQPALFTTARGGD